MNKCIALRKSLTVDEPDATDEKFKNIIRSSLKKDYVDNNILSQSELDNIINIWIDYI